MSEAKVPLVYIIVVTWNLRQDLLECLDSLFKMTYPNFRVVMIDNASTDSTLTAVHEQFPQVETIVNDKNLGFAVPVNQGIHYALEHQADHLLLLNNDTVVAPGLLDYLIAQAKDENIGMLIPKIYYYDRPKVIWSVGADMHPWTLEYRNEVRGQPDSGGWETVRPREYVTACALLLSHSAIQQVGLLDERFFCYYEDYDLSLRMRAAGYQILLVPQAHVWHKVSRSTSGRDSPYERYWMARCGILFFFKHVYGWRWLIVIPYRFGSAIKTTLRLLIQYKFEALNAYWRGLRDGLFMIFNPSDRP